MASIDHGNLVTPDDVLRTLPNGQPLVISQYYAAGETSGVVVLAVISCTSAIAVACLLTAIAISAWNTRKLSSPTLFVRSHVAAYFVSLLLCEIVQTIGSIMSIRWVQERAVSYGPYCTVQGVLKQIADVGTAYWYVNFRSIIALNTFCILFLRWRLGRYVLISTMIIGWSTIGAIITSGPTAIQRVDAGPFCKSNFYDAISGYWCWISDQYPSERITLDYLIMFLSALLSFVMYSLVFLRLRGNILVHGWHVSFHLRPECSEGSPKSIDTHVMNIAKGMLLYPVAYTILLLPIAICRFAEWTGHNVSFAATISSDAIFLLSGIVNVVLFLTTRRVLPLHSVLPKTVSSLFRSSNADQSSPRSSTFSASSFSNDPEKSILSCEESIRMQNSFPPRSALPNAVPTRYSANRPDFAIDSATSEAYGRISQDSSFDEVNITSASYHRGGSYK
ncbi:hypothetical protein BD309DRAFT_852116 [Dichomitus squalens]|nr:hypothetical protein BD309DRAFT_852116 [Dichomitus squalens]